MNEEAEIEKGIRKALKKQAIKILLKERWVVQNIGRVLSLSEVEVLDILDEIREE